MGNRKSKLSSAVIEKPTSNRNMVAEPVVVHAPVVITEPVVVTEPVEPNVQDSVVVTEPVEPNVQDSVVVSEPTVTSVNPVVHEPMVVTESVIATELSHPTLDPESTANIVQSVLLEPIPEVEEEQSARPTIKSDSSRSLKITFMSASHDPYAYLPKKEPETLSKHGKKFKKHQKHQKHQQHQKQQQNMTTEQEEDTPSSTNMEEMD